MRIDEIAQPIDKSLPFDVVDDMSVFMRNDPIFYRKNYLPVVYKMLDMHNAKKEIDGPKMFGPVIDKGANTYCKKFNIGKRPEELLSDEERNSLIEKLYSEEMSAIKKGVYK